LAYKFSLSIFVRACAAGSAANLAAAGKMPASSGMLRKICPTYLRMVWRNAKTLALQTIS
jgi:hypothetical protein